MEHPHFKTSPADILAEALEFAADTGDQSSLRSACRACQLARFALPPWELTIQRNRRLGLPTGLGGSLVIL
jgi:hypothetical protein